MEIIAKHHKLQIDDEELRIEYSTELMRISKFFYYIILISYILFILFRKFSDIFIPVWINLSWGLLFFFIVLLFATQRIIARYGKNKSQDILIIDISSIKLASGHKEIKAILYSNNMRLYEFTFISKDQAAIFIKEMQKVNPKIEWLQE